MDALDDLRWRLSLKGSAYPDGAQRHLFPAAELKPCSDLCDCAGLCPWRTRSPERADFLDSDR